ncbi:4Fe-4S dicluster domain-containing protein [Lutispora thermophila]|uniref:Electron transport complex, RnfABCDGE type, C subunit n=1 Tax=Lutispora thermophila DSM 19022 TaxID=1122184 RepID=A0A1M6FJ91_9FIRM|nr:4Fe-4S dicluster domain-containing protein [Lutispora thermophila]SHI97745.1 electron transport complex, RnfABCDGE type, C subunit [Lutispora thermophila DSM 19022]
MEDLIKIYDAGVVGAGGAGFPTYKKLNAKVEYFIINGAECEPLLQTDKYIMRERSEEVLLGVKKVAEIIKAEKVVFALKKKYQYEIESLKKAQEKFGIDLDFFLMNSIYPAGDEQVLVYEVTGRTVPPGGIPLQVGTVVSNVGTMLNVYHAMEGKPVIRKLVSVMGEVNNPLLLDVPIGISIRECIEAAGGSKLDGFHIILGGPMMGMLISSEDIDSRVVTKTTGGVIVIPSDHYLVYKNKLNLQHMINQTKSACIQCSYCTDMCPRYLIGHPIRPHKIMRKIGYSEEIDESFMDSLICCECGICELYACPMGISPRLVNIYVKNKLREKKITFKDDKSGPSEIGIREHRKVPVERLLTRIHMHKYDVKEPLKIKAIKTDRVSIPLRQHIGVAANPLVKVGDNVALGQLIASVNYGDLGANIHGSIDGVVVEIHDAIVIERKNSGVMSC